jgi:hypothetical protein
MTVLMGAACVVLLMRDPSTAPTGSPATLPGLPQVPVTPAGVPSWLAILGYVVGLFGLLGFGGIAVKIIDARTGRRRTSAEGERIEREADEVMTKVAITLVEPLRDRLAQTEVRMREVEKRAAEREQEYEREIAELRARVRTALTEADNAITEAHRVRILAQRWHRSIMDPSATLEWLRVVVGPDEPPI